MLRAHNNPFLIQLVQDSIAPDANPPNPSNPSNPSNPITPPIDSSEDAWYYHWWVITAFVTSIVLIIVLSIYLVQRYRQRNRISKRDLLLQGHDRGTISKQSFQVSSYAPPKYLPIENSMQEKFYPTLET
jgi:hypothetical protein